MNVEVIEILNRVGMEFYVEKEDSRKSHKEYLDAVLDKDQYDAVIDLQTVFPACVWYYNSVHNLDVEIREEDRVKLQELSDYDIQSENGYHVWIFKAN